MDIVRQHYNRFPYPPVPRLALPRAGGGRGLAWETGCDLAGREGADHKGIRILVAGAGTLEALVVAQQHPRAAEVVALDLSASSLAVLRHRAFLARVACYTLGLGVFRRVAPLRLVEADLAHWEDQEGFDYIIATNVLHHHTDPLGLLERLTGMLKEGGLLRLTTHPRASRLWPRAIGRYLHLEGMAPATPNLVQLAWTWVSELPADHPIRLAFENNRESRHPASLSHAYLHPVELPQPPLEWGRRAAALGLRLVGEGQHPLSRSDVVHELTPKSQMLDPWVKLQILDDLMELGSNPVLWLDKTDAPLDLGLPQMPRPRPDSDATAPAPGEVLAQGMDMGELMEAWHANPDLVLWLPSDLHVEMAQGLRRADSLLGDTPVMDVVTRLSRLFGPRVSISDARNELPGLTVHERDVAAALALPQPWTDANWSRLERQVGPRARLTGPQGRAPGVGLVAQARILQLCIGAREPWIGPLILSA